MRIAHLSHCYLLLIWNKQRCTQFLKSTKVSRMPQVYLRVIYQSTELPGADKRLSPRRIHSILRIEPVCDLGSVWVVSIQTDHENESARPEREYACNNDVGQRGPLTNLSLEPASPRDVDRPTTNSLGLDDWPSTSPTVITHCESL